MNEYKDPKMRVRSIEIRPDNTPSDLYPKILDYDLSTRITVKLSAASVDSEYHIEGIHHRFNANERLWITTWQLSDADMTQYWMIGDAGYSEIGEKTTVGY